MAMKLLIVEDSEHIRTSLLGLMECIPGIDCICTVSSLAEAAQRAGMFLPTFIVLDQQLPDGHGTELIKPFKLLVPGVHIAVFTNHANELNKRHCIAVGANYFFDKSTEFEGLLDVIRAHASIH